MVRELLRFCRCVVLYQWYTHFCYFMHWATFIYASPIWPCTQPVLWSLVQGFVSSSRQWSMSRVFSSASSWTFRCRIQFCPTCSSIEWLSGSLQLSSLPMVSAHRISWGPLMFRTSFIQFLTCFSSWLLLVVIMWISRSSSWLSTSSPRCTGLCAGPIHLLGLKWP